MPGPIKPSYKRRRFLKTGTATILGTGIGLSGCLGGGDGGADEPTETATPEVGTLSEDELIERAAPPDEIVASNFPVTGMEKVYYAIEAGLFEKRGLNVTLTNNAIFGGPQNIQAVASGDAHIACTVPTANPINFARSSGVFMPMLWSDNYMDLTEGWPDGAWLIAHEETVISAFEDLDAGSTIVTLQEAPVLIVAIRHMADQAGLDPFDDISINGVPLPEIGGAVAREEADAGVWLDPLILFGRSEGLPIKRVMPAHQWLTKGTVDGYWVKRDFADQYPHTTRLLQATFKEVNEHLLDDDKREDVFAQGAKMDLPLEIFLELWDRKYSYKPAPTFDEALPLESMQKMDRNLTKYTDVEGSVDVQQLLLPWNR